jgi:hypothetical protein
MPGKGRQKTRKLTDKELKLRMKAGCPACGAVLAMRQMFRRDDETGRSYPAGSFIGCSKFSKGCDAKYYVSPFTNIESVIEGVND